MKSEACESMFFFPSHRGQGSAFSTPFHCVCTMKHHVRFLDVRAHTACVRTLIDDPIFQRRMSSPHDLFAFPDVLFLVGEEVVQSRGSR